MCFLVTLVKYWNKILFYIRFLPQSLILCILNSFYQQQPRLLHFKVDIYRSRNWNLYLVELFRWNFCWWMCSCFMISPLTILIVSTHIILTSFMARTGTSLTSLVLRCMISLTSLMVSQQILHRIYYVIHSQNKSIYSNVPYQIH